MRQYSGSGKQAPWNTWQEAISIHRERTALALIGLVCFATGLKEPRFFQAQSVESVLLWMPLITVAAMGELIVILSGGIDISIGSMLGFSGIGVGLIFKANPHLPIAAALSAGFAIGFLLGTTNGVIISWGRVPPLVVTIATLASFRGLTFLLSRGDQIDSSMIPDSLTSLAHRGIPLGSLTFSWLLVFALGICFLTALFLRFSRLGRKLFAVGGNAEAAYLRGISISRTTFVAYAICGALAGLAGVMYAARFGFVNPGSAGQNFELTVIAAVVIGGTKLTGGEGSVLGVLLGCLLLSCINVALSVLGIEANWQMLTYGLVILAAIITDGARTRSRRWA